MYTRCCAEPEILKAGKEAAEQEDAGAVSGDEENPDRDEELALQNHYVQGWPKHSLGS
jgi:hypothetical protein